MKLAPIRRMRAFNAFAAAVVLAAILGGALQRARSAGAAAGATHETPWVRYVMVGMGGFRGIVSEVLWMRADRLQEQGRFFELAQLSEWINALDPRAADAWAFSAWNLAYNVSAMIPDADARLHWVLAGVSLLRDKAMPANPSAPSLYRELGWMYQNKIGGGDDPAHLTYKLDVARDATRPEGERHHTLVPDTVAEIEARFGPLDWRLPQSHAIHWAWRGLALNPEGFDRDALRRMVQQNLVVSIASGTFAGDAERGEWETAPRWALVRPTMAYFEETALANPAEGRVYRIFLAAMCERLRKAGQGTLAEEVARRLDELGGPPQQEQAEGHEH